MDKTLKLVFLVFSLIGLVFLILGVSFGIYQARDTAGMVAVEGRIVDFAHNGHPVVEYTLQGQRCSFLANSRSSSMRLGDAFHLKADPDDPARHAEGTLTILAASFAGEGGLFLLIGVILQVIALRRKRKMEELRLLGQRTVATVTEVRENHTVHVNGRSPWYVLASCRNPITWQEMTVKSTSYWHLHYEPGDSVDVLFDPMDPDKYIVDLPEDRA